MHKKTLKLSAKTLAFLMLLAVFLFLFKTQTQAAVGLSVGNSTLNLGSAENLFYGNIGATSHASSSFLLFQKNSADIFKVDSNGNLTTSGAISASALSGAITSGSINAANVSAGSFGANVAGGNYSFPGNLTVDGSLRVVGNPILGTLSQRYPYLRLDSWTSNNTGYFWGFGHEKNDGTNQKIHFFVKDSERGIYSADKLDVISFTANEMGQSSPTLYPTWSTGVHLAATGNSWIMGGGLGVGTANPETSLHISKTNAGQTAFLTLKNSNSGLGDTADINFSLSINPNLTMSRIGALRTNRVVSGDTSITFSTYSIGVLSEKMRILDNGNVGIGDTNPSSKLYVNGDANFTNTVTVGSPTAPAHAATKSYVDSAIFTATSTMGTLWGGSTSGNIWSLNSGNVGIGTTNPSSPLHIQGNYSGGKDNLIPQMKIINTSTTGGYSFIKTMMGTGYAGGYPELWIQSVGGTTGTVGVRGVGNHDMTFWTNDAEKMRLTKNGYVGIGTTGPGSRLAVSGGNIFINDAAITSGTPNAAITKSYLDSSLDAFNLANNFWQLDSVDDQLFASSTAWNVGIGVSDPSAKLDVSGKILLTTLGTIYNQDSTRHLDLSGVLSTSLELSGPIRFGNTGDACSASQKGQFKYDPVSAQSYLCDGTRWLNQKSCGIMTDEDGNTYGTVQIGGQCWTTENIKVGTMLASGATMPNTSDQVIEKWCYNDDPNNCDTYGGLYHWEEAMRGSRVAGARGICAPGWHIPTDAEYNILEKTVLGVIDSPNAQYVCDLSYSGWQRCADNTGTNPGANGVGQALRRVGLGSGVGAGTDIVGFNADLPGYRNTNASFGNRGSYLRLWSSTPASASTAWSRALLTSYSTVYRNASNVAYGFSVRCLKD